MRGMRYHTFARILLHLRPNCSLIHVGRGWSSKSKTLGAQYWRRNWIRSERCGSAGVLFAVLRRSVYALLVDKAASPSTKLSVVMTVRLRSILLFVYALYMLFRCQRSVVRNVYLICCRIRSRTVCDVMEKASLPWVVTR